jgi:hypothetical protein
LAEGEPSSVAPLEPATFASRWALGAFEVLELELVELEPSDDPPPQPARTSDAMASARMILALAFLAGLFIKRSRASSRNA